MASGFSNFVDPLPERDSFSRKPDETTADYWKGRSEVEERERKAAAENLASTQKAVTAMLLSEQSRQRGDANTGNGSRETVDANAQWQAYLDSMGLAPQTAQGANARTTKTGEPSNTAPVTPEAAAAIAANVAQQTVEAKVNQIGADQNLRARLATHFQSNETDLHPFSALVTELYNANTASMGVQGAYNLATTRVRQMVQEGTLVAPQRSDNGSGWRGSPSGGQYRNDNQARREIDNLVRIDDVLRQRELHEHTEERKSLLRSRQASMGV